MKTAKHGNYAALIGGPVEARFRSRYDVDDVTGCWNWNRGKFSSGYGALYVWGNNRPAHRVGYEMLVGPVALELELDHLCRNRGCVNPFHLEPVTHEENVRRGESRTNVAAVNNVCFRNHVLDQWNVYVRRDGRRQCKTCHRMREAGQPLAPVTIV